MAEESPSGKETGEDDEGENKKEDTADPIDSSETPTKPASRTTKEETSAESPPASQYASPAQSQKSSRNLFQRSRRDLSETASRNRIGSQSRAPSLSPVEITKLSENTSEPMHSDDSKSEDGRDSGSAVPQSAVAFASPDTESKTMPKTSYLKDGPQEEAPGANQGPFYGCGRFLERRSPFDHDPPYPEERRTRIAHPQSLRDYIINLREDLADFQESQGLPRTRDYSFLSLGLSLAQETGRAIYAVFLMITELFPIVAIISLILRFALDKLIDILETDEALLKAKKAVVFAFQMLIIMIPLWILIGTIIMPLFYLILFIFRKVFRLTGKSRQPVRKPCCKKVK